MSSADLPPRSWVSTVCWSEWYAWCPKCSWKQSQSRPFWLGSSLSMPGRYWWATGSKFPSGFGMRTWFYHSPRRNLQSCSRTWHRPKPSAAALSSRSRTCRPNTRWRRCSSAPWPSSQVVKALTSASRESPASTAPRSTRYVCFLSNEVHLRLAIPIK